MARRRVVALVTALAAVAAAVVVFLRPPTTGVLSGVVVDEAGAPVVGAQVEAAGGAVGTTDLGGSFAVEGPIDGTWVTVSAAGMLPRTRAARPGVETLVRLAADEGRTVTIAFGGDVMFGRRYFDPGEDGTLGGQLDLSAGVEDHRTLLAGVEPLLRSADLTVVNLETPLTADPYPDPTQPRPAGWHPTKDFVFSSLPAAAQALADSGVDVVGIANNHLYDRLEDGVASTVAALDDAGFRLGSSAFGGGADLDAAWEPAVVDVAGQRVAFIGCTTILGAEHDIDYVAGRAGPGDPGTGGAAPCDEERLDAAVAAAAGVAETVVVQVHGGFEYGRAPSDNIRRLSDAAATAGADLVINHHPHVVGGLRRGPSDLTAWTMGNLLFDQTVWPTFESYVLFVAVRDGEVASAWAEPIRLQGFRPTGVTGAAADWVARGALARSNGPWQLDDGSLWLGDEDAPSPVEVELAADEVAIVEDGCALDGGRELLWTGGFEDDDLDPTTVGGALWNVATSPSAGRRIEKTAAAAGDQGVRLTRSGGSGRDLLLAPEHRALVEPGDELTLLLQWRRVLGDADAAVELAWHNDTIGASSFVTSVPLAAEDGDWRPLRLDVVVPENARAVGVRVRVRPPAIGQVVLDVDEVRLVSWSEPGCDALRSPGQVRRALGADTGAGRAPPITVLDVPATPVDPPPALPAAPPRTPAGEAGR